jgi:hypothetical protein
MLVGLALAAAVAGGNLAVTAPPHPPFGRYVTIRATGQVGRDGELYTYRNRGAPCGVSRDAEEALGRSKALELHAPHKVERAFEFRTDYLPTLFGVSEWICSYLYASTCDVATGQCGSATGLPPDAGFSRTRLSIRFALPPGWKAGGSSSAVRMSAVPGSARRVRVTIACGRGLRLQSLAIDRAGRFDYAGGSVRLRGRVLRSTRRVKGRLTANGCGTRLINLAARAPKPPQRPASTPAGARPARARPATT